MAIIIKPPVSGGGGGGAVDSVNGQTGVVVLTTDNIAEGSNADRQYFTSADQGNVSTLQSDVSTLQSDMTTAQSDISTLQSDVSTAQSDISTLQSDMTTAQSDISTLQSDVSTAQSDILSVQAKTLYSNSYYVNDAVNDIQTVLDGIAGSSGISAIYMSVGSYGGSTVTISNHANVNILAPESPTGVHGCELLSRGLTISGASTTRIKIENLNIEGAFLINGTEGRHYFKNVIFDSTVTINNACANFITFEQCSFAGGISIASNVTATVYFDRCNLGNQLITSSRSGAGSPLLTILTECSGVNALQTNLTSNVALVGRTGFNSGLVVQYQNSDNYVYDLNNGLSTSFSGSYSELRNKPTIPTSSDDLTEGSTNLFYTNSRFDTRLATKTTDNLTQGSSNLYFTNALAKTAAVVNSMAGAQTDQAPSVSSVKAYYTAGTGISLTSGTIASTITQYTDTDADARISLQKGANNGICELDANGLVPTNHLPPLAITDVHVVADAAARLALVAQEGDVAIQTDDSSSWIYDGSAWVAFGVSGAVLSVNGQTGTVSLDTDDISEGSTNQYFTSTRAKTAAVVNSTAGSETDQAPSVSAMKSYVTANGGTVDSVNSVSPVDGNVTLTTDNITQGLTNLYFTNTNFDNRLATKTTDNLTEGSTNLYYTSTRVNSAFDTRLATKTTDNLTEGSTNKYFSDTLARNAFSAGTGITITSGQIATTITQYTDALAKTAAVVNSTAGSETDQAPSVSAMKGYVSTQISDIQAIIGANGTLVYQGTYNATTNTPTLANAKKGFFYQVSVSGTLAGVSLTTNDQIVFVSDVSGGVVQSTDFIVIDNTETPISSGNMPVVPITLNNSTLVTNAYNLIINGGAWNLRLPRLADVSIGSVIYLRVRSTNQQILVTTASGTTDNVVFFYNESNSGGFNSFAIQSGQSGEYIFRCTGKNTTTQTLTFEVFLANTTRTTDDLREGSTNKYVSSSNVRPLISATAPIVYTQATGVISTTLTQYTDELAQDASASLFTGGTHTGISYSYVDSSNVINSTVSLSGFSINALSDVDTATVAPTNGQALVWESASSQWKPGTVGGGGGGSVSRPTISDKTSNFTIITPDASVLQEIYTVSGSSAVTMTLPDATACSGMRYDIKRLGTATVTIACNGIQTIDTLSTIQLLAQYASVTVISTGTNWIII